MHEKKDSPSISEQELSQAVGQMLVVGFQGDGPSPPAAIADALSTEKIGGVILFRRNVSDIEQVSALNKALHKAAQKATLPPFIAVDQEGGRVVRVREPLTPIPPMRIIGATRDYDWITKVSEVIATEVAALGFNLNFAPVLDVDTNADNPVIGDRAFSALPEEVARAGGAFLLGHLMSGVIPCGKHFPGHGDTLVDSHIGLPIITHEMERLQAVELLPFQRLAKVGIPMLMTAHILLPELDAFHPATLSTRIIEELLRKEMGYDGVVITDDLEMKSVAERYSIEEMVELGLRAGIDVFLICHTQSYWKRAYDHLMHLAKNNPADRARILQSARRVGKLKRDMLGHLPRPWEPEDNWQKCLGSDTHRKILATHASLQEHIKNQDPTEA